MTTIRLAMSAVLCGTLLVAQTPPGMTKGPSVEGITEYRMANGLRVLLFPDPSKNTATVNMTYLVGSRHENYGETGMAHLLEHLVFKGTPKHPDIPKELTAHGARPNGSTWFDRTNYFETFRATEENMRWALDLESDRMINSFIARKDLDSEMTVVRNEYERSENSSVGVTMDRVMAAAFIWHNYGKSTIGSRADIENVNIDRLQAFYRRYYQPDNAVLLIAGRIEEAETLKLVHEYFSKIPKPTRVLEPTYTAEPVQDGERSVTVRRVGDQKFAGAVYHIPAAAHADNPLVQVASMILGTSPSGRLYKALVETKKAVSVAAGTYDLREPGMAVFYAMMRKEGDVDDVRKTMIDVIEGLSAKPFTQEEVDRARRDITKQVELQLNDPERVGLFMSEFIGAGDWRLYFWLRDRMEGAALDEVQRAAVKYLRANNRTTGVFIPEDKPERAEIPAAPDPAVLLKDYQGRKAVSQGEAFDPSPANIDSRSVRRKLSNGMSLVLLPKKTRGEKVNVSLAMRYGDEKQLAGKASVSAAANGLLENGTSKRTRQQIKDELDRLKARANLGGGGAVLMGSAEAARSTLPGVLRLMAEMLREPVYPQQEFDLWKQRALARVESMRREPQALAGLAYSRHMNPYPKGDVRYTRTLDEEAADLQAVTVERVREFHKEFHGASNAEMSIVGDFDLEATVKLLEELLGGWKSPKPFTKIKSMYQPVETKAVAFETPDKANAVIMAGFPVKITDEDENYPAFVLANYIFGGGFLNSRLASRIRQKDGLSYGVSGQFGVTPQEDAGRFTAYAIAAPQNIVKVEQAMREELARALKDGFTAEEVKSAKSGWLQSRQVSRGQDGGLANQLSSNALHGRTMAYSQWLESKVDALSPEEVNAAFRKFMDPSKLSVFKAGDFAKAAKP